MPELTESQSIRICKIISEADGGCESCVRSMLADLMNSFPDVDWINNFQKAIHDRSYWEPKEVATDAYEVALERRNEQ